MTEKICDPDTSHRPAIEETKACGWNEKTRVWMVLYQQDFCAPVGMRSEGKTEEWRRTKLTNLAKFPEVTHIAPTAFKVIINRYAYTMVAAITGSWLLTCVSQVDINTNSFKEQKREIDHFYEYRISCSNVNGFHNLKSFQKTTEQEILIWIKLLHIGLNEFSTSDLSYMAFIVQPVILYSKLLYIFNSHNLSISYIFLL